MSASCSISTATAAHHHGARRGRSGQFRCLSKRRWVTPSRVGARMPGFISGLLIRLATKSRRDVLLSIEGY